MSLLDRSKASTLNRSASTGRGSAIQARPRPLYDRSAPPEIDNGRASIAAYPTHGEIDGKSIHQ
jgi:hypothetical protein